MLVVLSLIAILILALLLIPQLAPEATVALFRSLGRKWAGVRAHKINVDGCDWHYLDNHQYAKPTLLLLHGFGADKDNWLQYIKIIGPQYRVIAADIQGFGESHSDPQLGYTIADQVARLRRFIELLGLTQVHLCGNSMGGFIAGTYSADYPDQVLSLLLMNAAGLPSTRATTLSNAIANGKTMLLPQTVAEANELISIVSSKPFYTPTWLKQYMVNQVTSRHAFFQTAFNELLAAHKCGQLGTRLSQIRCPSLVMWGRDDQLVDVSSAEYAAAHIANSRLVIFDNIGHVPMVENPHQAWAEHQQLLQDATHNK